ncbi:unnamed protein product [Cyprideis torosa]|uniref:Uncharacterized protein n=1 Tax=Cyprideis torosa TaxID=163714 RepID=A0A7R8WFR8_9CRUS|nr:unnamed protein product [Cyprideis torosa]CAG0897342.1 unnamed protein product [Cyprideis torosa]
MAATERLSPTPAAAMNLCPPTSLLADVQMIPLPSSPTCSMPMPQPSTSFMSSTPKTSKSTAHLPFRVLDTTSDQGSALVTSTPIPTEPHESPERLIIDVSLATDTTISTVADPKDVSYVPSEDAASEASSDCEKDLAVEERGWNARYVVVDRKILLQLIRSSSCQKKPNCTAKVMDIREHRKPDGASYSVRVTCDLVAVKNWTVGLKHITGDHCECIHQPYDPSVDKRNYLNPKNSVYEEAKKIICNKQLLSDIERSCHYYFTSSLESYHSLKLKYAAKRVHYQYPSMECRVLLSILDHNENIHRESYAKRKSLAAGAREGSEPHL